MATPRKENPARRGPKPTYDPDRHPVLVKWMARAGQTGEQIAAELGVARQTLLAWAKLHPELSGALRGGRDEADALVEDCLFRRATGYDYEDHEVRQVTTEEEVPAADERASRLGQTRRTSKTVRTVRKVKYHCPPDVGAITLWLKNRRPQTWREKPDPNATPANPFVFDLSVLSDEELSLLHAVRKKLAAPAARTAPGSG